MADFNGDGRPDIAAINRDQGNVSVLLGAAGGGFGGAENYDAGASPSAVTTLDADMNGTADLAVTAETNNQVSVLLGAGDGTFTAGTAVTLTANSVPRAVAAGDLMEGSVDGLGEIRVRVA